MAPTPVSVVPVTRTGATAAVPVACDIVNGNSVPNTKGLDLVLTNGGASPHNVTFTTPTTLGGYAVSDPQIAIPAGATRHFGDFPTDVFGGTLVFTADSVEVTAAAYKAP